MMPLVNYRLAPFQLNLKPSFTGIRVKKPLAQAILDFSKTPTTGQDPRSTILTTFMLLPKAKLQNLFLNTDWSILPRKLKERFLRTNISTQAQAQDFIRRFSALKNNLNLL